MCFSFQKLLAFAVCCTAACSKRCSRAARAPGCWVVEPQASMLKAQGQQQSDFIVSEHCKHGNANMVVQGSLLCSSSGLRSQQALPVAVPFSLLLNYGPSKL